MKITKRQLRRIIKEEKQKLQERDAGLDQVYDGIFDGVMDMLEQEAMAGGLDLSDSAVASAVADALKDAANQLVNDAKLSSGAPEFIDMTDPREL